MQSAPIISVILPCFNAQKTIACAIQSILRQDTDEAFEVLVVDDGSTDASASIVEEIGLKHSNVRLVRLESNRGIATALNCGIAAARGRIIARQDADDLSFGSRFTSQLRRLQESKADMVVSRYLRRGKIRPLYWRSFITLRSLRFNNYLCHGTFMVKRETFNNWGVYDPTWSVAQDYEFLLRVLSRGGRIAFDREIVYEFSCTPTSISAMKRDLQTEFARRALRAHYTERHFTLSAPLKTTLLRNF